LQSLLLHGSLLTLQFLAIICRRFLRSRSYNLNSVVERLAKMPGRVIGDNITLKMSKGPSLRNIKVDLLLRDVVMKGMNGRQLAEAVSAKRQGLKGVYMSGYTENTSARGGVLGEDILFIQKPVRPGTHSRKIWAVDAGRG
jgi:two-component SAPR family response regulator